LIRRPAVYNRRHPTALVTLLRTATVQLDPLVPLLDPAGA
jgi:hypothetical protein